MRFLHVISILDPVYGGLVERVIQLAAGLKALRHYTEIVALDNINEFQSHLENFGIVVAEALA
jgi:hypothetical protein